MSHDLSPADDPQSRDALPWDDAPEAADEAAVQLWWAGLPDVFKPDYPFDLPPLWLPYAVAILSLAEADRHCPRPECRRAKACLGGDGPPCFRADRAALQQVLLLGHLVIVEGMPLADYAAALRRTGSRYVPEPEPAPVLKRPARRRRRPRRSALPSPAPDRLPI